jgi:hypothetical protein
MEVTQVWVTPEHRFIGIKTMANGHAVEELFRRALFAGENGDWERSLAGDPRSPHADYAVLENIQLSLMLTSLWCLHELASDMVAQAFQRADF